MFCICILVSFRRRWVRLHLSPTRRSRTAPVLPPRRCSLSTKACPPRRPRWTETWPFDLWTVNTHPSRFVRRSVFLLEASDSPQRALSSDDLLFWLPRALTRYPAWSLKACDGCRRAASHLAHLYLSVEEIRLAFSFCTPFSSDAKNVCSQR